MTDAGAAAAAASSLRLNPAGGRSGGTPKLITTKAKHKALPPPTDRCAYFGDLNLQGLCVRRDLHGSQCCSARVRGDDGVHLKVSPPQSCPKMSQGPNLVLEWLSKLHLAQYVEAFIDNGYDDLEVCKQIGEPDLDAIGVRIQYHRHRLIAAVQRLKEEDKRKAPGYYFTLEPLIAASCHHHTSHVSIEDDFGTLRSHSQTTGVHQASCPGNHNLRFTDCNDFVTYPKLKLKVLIRDKLAKDGINLGEAPYTHTV
ncbi:hypothetical protein INR49_013050, partial [Caranx melampygus]